MIYCYDFEHRVAYVETDKMGVVHNSNYYRLFEIGRTETMRILDITYKEMEDKGVMMPLVEQYAKYLKPSYYDEVLTIRTLIREIPSSKFIFDYKVLRVNKGSEEIVCEGYTILAFISSETRRPVRCPEWVKELLEKKLCN